MFGFFLLVPLIFVDALEFPTSYQCDWHYRSYDMTLVYNNEGSQSHRALVELFRDLYLVEAARDGDQLLRPGHVISVSGLRYSSAESFLRDREGRSLGLCTQRDEWGGIFTITDNDTSEMERSMRDNSWFLETSNVTGEDLAVIAVTERMREINMAHPHRINLQLIITERPPLRYGERCDTVPSVDDIIVEAAKGSHVLVVIAENERTYKAWEPICKTGVCVVDRLFFSANREEEVKKVIMKLTDNLSGVEDFFGIGPCSCFAEDVVNMKLSWLWPEETISIESQDRLFRWRLLVEDFLSLAVRATIDGGSINNSASIHLLSYGDPVLCDTSRVVIQHSLNGDTTLEEWFMVGESLRELLPPVLNPATEIKGPIHPINSALLEPQVAGELQVIAIYVDVLPFLTETACQGNPDLPRIRRYLFERPERAAYLLIYAYGEPWLVEAWNRFCEFEVPGRCEVVDITAERFAFTPEEYASKVKEIRGKFSCEREADGTFPTTPTAAPTTPE